MMISGEAQRISLCLTTNIFRLASNRYLVFAKERFESFIALVSFMNFKIQMHLKNFSFFGGWGRVVMVTIAKLMSISAFEIAVFFSKLPIVREF